MEVSLNWELKTAFLLGVLHSLEPGHGKTAMLSMALDSKKNWWSSVSLALSIVTSHSALIFTIAALTHLSGHYLLSDNIAQKLSENIKILGPLLLMSMGLFLMLKPNKRNDNCCRSQSKKNPSDQKFPILLGISIGLFPCPSLIATFLASLSTGNLSLGLQAVCIFSFGSFVSIVSSTILLKWLGGKVKENLTSQFAWMSSKALQGCIIFIAGAASLLIHR